MAKFQTLKEAVAEHVRSGQTIALEGFTHLIPFAAGHEIIRQQIGNLTLIRMTPDLIYDQMIGMGCVSKLIFSWGGNPGVGSLHRLRDAVENDFPQKLEIEEYSHAAIANAFKAGASGLPFAVLDGFKGTDLAKVDDNRVKWVTCPFTGKELSAVKALNPDVTIIHAQQADKDGNVKLWGILGIQKEAALSAKKVIVTVEEVVDSFEGTSNDAILPNWAISSVAEVPGGARPSYAMGFYKRSNAFYKNWDEISRDRDVFLEWMQKNILEPEHHPLTEPL